MEILNIILAGVLALFGFPAGLVLAKLAREELEPGKNYFILMQKSLVIISVMAVLYIYDINLYLTAAIGVISTVAAIDLNLKPKIIYPFFAVLFMLSLKTQDLLIVMSSVIFLYGLPAAALVKLKQIKDKK